RIPKNLNFRTLNPRIRLEGTPLRLATEPVAWPRSARPRFAGVSAFSMCGTNAHVVLEEAPSVEPAPRAPVRSAELFVLSAKTSAAVDEQAARLRRRVEAEQPPEIGDLAFSLATTRAGMDHRLAFTATSMDALRIALEEASRGETPSGGTRAAVRSSREK